MLPRYRGLLRRQPRSDCIHGNSPRAIYVLREELQSNGRAERGAVGDDLGTQHERADGGTLNRRSDSGALNRRAD